MRVCGRGYLFGTHAFEYACGGFFSETIEQEINTLIDRNLPDPHSPFYDAYVLVGGVAADGAMAATKEFYAEQLSRLIATLVLVVMAQWQMRFTKKFKCMLYRLLLFPETLPSERDDRRAGIAKDLLDCTDDELRLDYHWTDIPLKLRELFYDEFIFVRDNFGLCPERLYMVLLMLRARLPYETQENRKSMAWRVWDFSA